MHTLALAVVTDLINYAKLLGLAFEDDPNVRLTGYRDLVRTQALVENYTSERANWGANDVESGTMDLAWYMAVHRYELETESTPN